jgi:hypothetical protein
MIPKLVFFIQILLLSFFPGTLTEKTPDKEDIPDPVTDDSYTSLSCPELSQEAFRIASEGFKKMKNESLLSKDTLLTIIDFSKPSTEKRLFVVDMKNLTVIEKSLVAHGINSGVLFAEKFSNVPRSKKSSLGFYITGNTYMGKHGYSLKISGIEPGINTNAMKRAIVIHGARYVSDIYIAQYGRLGRSYGCPALPYDQHTEIINLIKGKSCLFIYANDPAYRHTSKIISSDYFAQTTAE